MIDFERRRLPIPLSPMIENTIFLKFRLLFKIFFSKFILVTKLNTMFFFVFSQTCLAGISLLGVVK